MKYAYPKNTKIYLLSCNNLNAERIYIKIAQYFDVLAFVSPYYNTDTEPEKLNTIYNKRVISFDQFLSEYDNLSKIILFEHDETKLSELIQLLKGKGFSLFNNYITWEYLVNPSILNYNKVKTLYKDDINYEKIQLLKGNRHTIIVNGNCQTNPIKKYLLANKVFRENFLLIDFPEICNVKDENIDEIISYADFVLTQPISKENRFTSLLSTDYIKEKAQFPKNVIVFSNVSFTGYYPQFCSSNSVKLGFPVAFYGDKEITNLAKSKSCDEIKDILLNDNYYSKIFLQEHFSTQLDVFKQREEKVDVKMYDYIFENYDKEILFHSYNHPIAKVLKELSKRILKYLFKLNGLDYRIEFEDEYFVDINNELFMSLQEQPIYPSVLKFIKLKTNNRFYPNKFATPFRMDFEEYVEFYYNALPAKYKECSVNIKIDKKRTISIFGSCVSRELFNYIDGFNILSYYLQNPMHTLFYKSFPIDEKCIRSTSNFTKRMLILDSSKTTIEEFIKSAKADYIIIDTADCRSDWWQHKNNSDIRLCSSLTSDATINANKELSSIFKKESFDTVTDEQWAHYVDEFCTLLTKKYKESEIILNEFQFARFYLSDGKIVEFPYYLHYQKQNTVTDKVAGMIKQRLPNINIITPYWHPLSDDKHHLGLSALHYTPETYKEQVNKLRSIIKY